METNVFARFAECVGGARNEIWPTSGDRLEGQAGLNMILTRSHRVVTPMARNRINDGGGGGGGVDRIQLAPGRSEADARCHHSIRDEGRHANAAGKPLASTFVSSSPIKPSKTQ